MTIPPASGRWEPYTPPATGPIADIQAAAAAAGGPAYVIPAYAAGPLADQLLAELLAVQDAVAPLRRRIQETNRQALATFMSYVVTMTDTLPEPARAPMRHRLARLLSGVDTDVRAQIWEALTRALFYGHQTALSYIPDSQMYLPDPAQLQWLEQVAAATQARLDAAVASARAFVQTGLNGDFDQVLSALTPIQDAVNKLDRDVRWATNAAYNQAVRAAADEHGLSRMWVAERDACLHCLALSGHVAGPGQPYDASLTFYIGPEGLLKPLPVYPPGPLWGPPRHPNCRCHQVPLPDISGYPVMPWETGPTTPGDALQREARRSVLRGTSGSDSLPARIRATNDLLNRGAGLPVSVERRARRAVRRRSYG